MTKEINFQTLYRKFRFKVIRHFLFTVLWVFWNVVLFGVITGLFQKEEILNDYNYAKILIPEKVREWGVLSRINIGKVLFIIIGLLLVMGYALIRYWNYLWEEELRVRGEHCTKNILLNKFRHLLFEEKQAKKDEVNKLVESDSWDVGRYWEHLPNHIFHSVLMIISLLFFHWGKLEKMTGQTIGFSFFWLGLLNIITYFFTKKILKNEKKMKKRQCEEWAIIDKERSNITLIEEMGLTSQYKGCQEKITSANESLYLNFSRTKSLSKIVPNNLLMNSFPFLLLGLSGSSFNGVVLVVFWWIFGNFSSIFQCLWDYADYASSRSRINNFLALPEKDDNLTGIKLNSRLAIKSIKFENVSFAYKGQKEWIVRHYNRSFSLAKINYLRGKNGTGKSTILFLLLGVIKPQEGKIIVCDEKGQTYNLHQDINLAVWRTNNVAYCAHETLIEEGSTGQKQLTNIKQALTNKKDCQIFLFDEADNALDEDNQKEFGEKLKELVLNKSKIIIYIKH